MSSSIGSPLMFCVTIEFASELNDCLFVDEFASELNECLSVDEFASELNDCLSVDEFAADVQSSSLRLAPATFGSRYLEVNINLITLTNYL